MSLCQGRDRWCVGCLSLSFLGLNKIGVPESGIRSFPGGFKDRWGLSQDAGNRWGQFRVGEWCKALMQPCFYSESIFLVSHFLYFRVQRFELEPECCHFPCDLYPPQACFLKCRIYMLIMNLCRYVFSHYVLDTNCVPGPVCGKYGEHRGNVMTSPSFRTAAPVGCFIWHM